MMKLSYDKKEDIPEALADHYKEVDGKWVAQVEGMKTQADIDKLQEALRKEREDHDASKTALKEAKSSLGTSQDELEALKKSGGKSEKDEPTHQDLVELSRLRRENEALTAENTEVKGNYDKLSTEVTSGKIKDNLRAAFGPKMRKEAVEMQVDHALRDFVLSDGKVLTKPELGDKSGLTADAYADNLLSTQSYLAPPSNSGGAGGGSPKTQSDSGKGESAEDHYKGLMSPNGS
jgi:hypothetical protein